MVRIKVCGMRDESNIKQIAALKPDYMGFIFYRHSKRFFGENFNIINDVPKSIQKVGVFVNEDPETVIKIAGEAGLDQIQLHGSESVETCSRIKSEGYHIIKAFGIEEGFDFSLTESYCNVCDFFLFDAKTESYGGSGRKFNWDLLKNYCMNVPYFISGGIGSSDEDLVRIINDQRLYAVDINSRFETEPGIKDWKKVEQFINEIRQH